MSDRVGAGQLERELLQLCGLSALLAPGLLRRALADVGAGTPPSADDYLRALPMLETRMLAYLPRHEVRERSARIRVLLAAPRPSEAPPAPA